PLDLAAEFAPACLYRSDLLGGLVDRQIQAARAGRTCTTHSGKTAMGCDLQRIVYHLHRARRCRTEYHRRHLPQTSAPCAVCERRLRKERTAPGGPSQRNRSSNPGLHQLRRSADHLRLVATPTVQSKACDSSISPRYKTR